MKYRIFTIAFAVLALVGCSLPQAESSAVYIASETATAAILAKNPGVIPVAKTLVADWSLYQAGTLTPAAEASLLQQVVASTKGAVTPTEAAGSADPRQPEHDRAHAPDWSCRRHPDDRRERHGPGRHARHDPRNPVKLAILAVLVLSGCSTGSNIIDGGRDAMPYQNIGHP